METHYHNTAPLNVPEKIAGVPFHSATALNFFLLTTTLRGVSATQQRDQNVNQINIGFN